MINAQITPNGIPCFNQNLLPKPTSQEFPYKLLIHKESGCDKYGPDSKFSKQLDSQALFDSYTQKAFRYSIVNLPYFEKYSKNTMYATSLRMRMMIHKDNHCLNIDEKFIQKSIRAFHQSFAPDEKISNILILYVILLLFYGLPRCCMTSASYFKFLPRMMRGTTYISLMFNFPLALQFLSSFENYQEMKIIKRYFAEYELLGCFGEGQGSMVIHNLLEILAIGEMKFLMFFALLLFNGLALLVSGWYLLLQMLPSKRNLNPRRD